MTCEIGDDCFGYNSPYITDKKAYNYVIEVETGLMSGVMSSYQTNLGSVHIIMLAASVFRGEHTLPAII